MDKCRICLKDRRKLHSIYDAENNITFIDMITNLINIKIHNDDGVPDKLCSLCRDKLREAYEFKIVIERSETVLNESAKLKRISFNNIDDIKIHIKVEPDTKPLIPIIEKYSNDLFKDSEQPMVYNDIVIKKIKDVKFDQKPQLSVREFLNSVKLESHDDYDNNYEVDIEYDPDSDSDYTYGKSLKTKKKSGKKWKSKGNQSDISQKSSNLIKPIKPIFLNDVRIERTQFEKKQIDCKLQQKVRPPRETSICPYCGKILLATSIKNHLLSHTGEKSFKCERCPKMFFTDISLRNHSKTHIEERNYKCDQCIASFPHKSALNSHLLSHSTEKNHVCDICKKAFKLKPHLTRHLFSHNFGNKPIQCELCSKTFYAQYALRHHMRVHTRERPFKCEICSQPYSYKHDFNRHCLKKHGVFLKRRAVYIMNDEVLIREKALMRDLTLHAHGVINEDEIISTFNGPQGAMAYKQAMKAIEAKLVPMSF